MADDSAVALQQNIESHKQGRADEAAIRRAVTSGVLVLDIGIGAGLMAVQRWRR